MLKNVCITLASLFIGMALGYIVFFYSPVTSFLQKNDVIPGKQVVGFLPYFLLNRAKTDYSDYLTTLTYFGLRVDSDGSILKLTNPQEEEPGWYALESGKAAPFLNNAIKNGENLSILISNGDQNSIDLLMANPIPHAKTLISEIIPVMKKYNFKDLNLDIEKVGDASTSAQKNFTLFVKIVKEGLNKQNAGTLTIDVSPTDLIKKDLINVSEVAPFANYILIMGYDYHYTGSLVTGPVSPLYGAGISSEYDVATAVGKAKEIIPDGKIILGVPLYGYSWETILPIPRAGVIPDTGITESTRTVSDFISSCATCSASFDFPSEEPYVIYKDQDTGTYHQIFWPDKKAMDAKIQYIKEQNLGGVALWALGYEDSNILSPVSVYKNSL